MSFFVVLVAIAVGSSFAGYWIAKGFLAGRSISSGKAFILIMALCALWFVAAWQARPYADTDRPGSQFAEWFAHAGKWWVLLAGAMAGHGIATALKQLPPKGLRRLAYLFSVATIITLVGLRTMPVYFFLGEGSRDEHGFLIQSRSYEYTCAPVALLNFLERYQHRTGITERAVSRACMTTVEGSTTAALVRGAHSFGLINATARVITWEELLRYGRPAIVSISTLPTVHHATLLTGIDAEHVFFIDPAYGFWVASHAHFREIWYGKTVLLE